jgi:ABC-2 type transport system permease protein
MIILGQMSLLDRAGIILKVNFPRQIAVISSLFTAVINFIINMFLVIFIIILSGIQFNLLGMLYIVFVAIITFIFCIGLAFFTSVITIKFRDLKNVFELAIFLLYWATPIVYVIDNDNVTGNFTGFVAANPIGIIINQVRAALGIYGSVNFPLMLLYLAFSCLFVMAGWVYFSLKVKMVAEFF